MKRRLKTTHIIIHCSATGPSLDIGVPAIRRWHLAKGWSDIGYHWVIRRNGKIEAGRPEHLVGAHCAAGGMNQVGIAVCLVGGSPDGRPNSAQNNFTAAQWRSLKKFIVDTRARYRRQLTLRGHEDYDPGKACPSFDVRSWAESEGIPND